MKAVLSAGLELSFDISLEKKIQFSRNSVAEIHHQSATEPAKLSSLIDLQWFAAEDEGRTEEPSERKLKKAREEGRVAKSTELNGALVLLLPVLAIVLLAPWMFKIFVQVIRFYFERCVSAELTEGSLFVFFLNSFAKLVLPIGLVALVSGVVGNLIQNKGFMFTTKTIQPKFSKVLPKFGEYFKKTLFSFEGAFNVFKSLFKVVILFVIAYSLISSEMDTLLSLMDVSLWSGFVFIGKMTAKLLIIAAFIFLAVAIPDYLVQRRQFMESMKMTKQEVKEEFKEEEGDPLVKSRLRQQMRELLYQNLPKAVSEADVVITNPTHYAVAVKYDSTKADGPMVTAKGQDDIAQRIKTIAKENSVEIVENKLLARELYAKVEIGAIIPNEYFQAMAIILSKVYTMKGKKF